VHLGEGSDEYRRPAEFFRRTFLTESLKRLLVGGVQRLSGEGGDPVVQLQTNFGGGKTHSMLALYHLFGGAAPGELAGIDAVLAEAGVKSLPRAKRIVLVGNRISPGNPVTKSDGTVVRTLWGELVWQLGGAKAFARVAKDDENATSSATFRSRSPCLGELDRAARMFVTTPMAFAAPRAPLFKTDSEARSRVVKWFSTPHRLRNLSGLNPEPRRPWRCHSAG
jgi:predicted AAA+ superfamily ATPase